MSASSQTNESRKTTILFLCTGNSCRSQMAEGWARHLRGDRLEVHSAGIETHGLNPRAVRVMAEAGLDIGDQHSKLIEDLPTTRFDYVITLCDHAHETCPYLPGRIVHHSFADPPLLTRDATSEEEVLDGYRLVRDQIKRFIESLPDSLPK